MLFLSKKMPYKAVKQYSGTIISFNLTIAVAKNSAESIFSQNKIAQKNLRRTRHCECSNVLQYDFHG
jgi:hypothetical protein